MAFLVGAAGGAAVGICGDRGHRGRAPGRCPRRAPEPRRACSAPGGGRQRPHERRLGAGSSESRRAQRAGLRGPPRRPQAPCGCWRPPRLAARHRPPRPWGNGRAGVSPGFFFFTFEFCVSFMYSGHVLVKRDLQAFSLSLHPLNSHRRLQRSQGLWFGWGLVCRCLRLCGSSCWMSGLRAPRPARCQRALLCFFPESFMFSCFTFECLIHVLVNFV